MSSSGTILGLLGIQVKFRASPAFWFPPVWGLGAWGRQFPSDGVCSFHLTGSASCQSSLGMRVRQPGDSALWLVYSPKCYEFPGPASTLCLFIFTFLVLTLEPAFWDSGEAWETKAFLQTRGRQRTSSGSVPGRPHRVLLRYIQTSSYVSTAGLLITSYYLLFKRQEMVLGSGYIVVKSLVKD